MVMVAKAFEADRERLADRAERQALVRYLRAGRLVVATSAKDQDRLVLELGRVVPLSFRTDGVWVWSEAVAYYVEKHGIAPEPALRAHAAEEGYQVPEVPDELVRAASRAVVT